MAVRMHATMVLNEHAFDRARRTLRGAPRRVKQHRVTVGLHEDEGARRKRGYDYAEGNALLILVATVHEFGAGPTPDRSFVRSWFDSNLDELKRDAHAAMVAEYNGDHEAVLKQARAWGDNLRAWIMDNRAALAELKQSTKRARRANDLQEGPPLVATEQLARALRAMVDGEYVS